MFKRALKGKAGINAQKKNALELLLQHLTYLWHQNCCTYIAEPEQQGPPRTSEKKWVPWAFLYAADPAPVHFAMGFTYYSKGGYLTIATQSMVFMHFTQKCEPTMIYFA